MKYNISADVYCVYCSELLVSPHSLKETIAFCKISVQLSESCTSVGFFFILLLNIYMTLSLSHFPIIATVVFSLSCFSREAFVETDVSSAEQSVPLVMIY